MVNVKLLSRKYHTDVNRLIKAWKRGYTDQEIALKTGLPLATICLIREEIELAHRLARLRRSVPHHWQILRYPWP